MHFIAHFKGFWCYREHKKPDGEPSGIKGAFAFMRIILRLFEKLAKAALDVGATVDGVHVVVVEVAVVAVEDPRVIDVVPLSEPTVRAGRSHIWCCYE